MNWKCSMCRRTKDNGRENRRIAEERRSSVVGVVLGKIEVVGSFKTIYQLLIYNI